MITYIWLLSFTDKGLQSVKDTTKRAAAAKDVVRAMGVDMRDIWWTMGDCDLVCALEADSETAIAAFSLAVATQGSVHTRSIRAYTAGEMDTILSRLP